MANKPTTRDGVSISNLWKERDRRHGAHWRYRVRDTLAGRYRSAVFKDHPEHDKDRREPGCAEGDQWAAKQGARFTLALDTANPASLAAVSSAYLLELRDRQPPVHATTIRNVELAVEGLKAAKVDDMSHPGFRAKVGHWLAHLKSSRAKGSDGKTAQSTRARYLTHIRALVNYARRRDLLAKDPLREMQIETPDANREVFTLADLRQLAALNKPTDAAWLWTMLMVYTGMRREEAMAAQWGDIDWDARVLRIPMGKGRGGKRRTIYLMDEAYDMLATIGGPEVKQPRVGRIVPCTTKSGVTWAQFRNLLSDEADIEPDRGVDRKTKMPRRLSPHSCRHTFATLMLASGADGTDLRLTLGHSSDDLTEYYSQQRDLFRRQVQEEGWERGQFYLLRPAPAGPSVAMGTDKRKR